jgi:hypothetical protein
MLMVYLHNLNHVEVVNHVADADGHTMLDQQVDVDATALLLLLDLLYCPLLLSWLHYSVLLKLYTSLAQQSHGALIHILTPYYFASNATISDAVD